MKISYVYQGIFCQKNHAFLAENEFYPLITSPKHFSTLQGDENRVVHQETERRPEEVILPWPGCAYSSELSGKMVSYWTKGTQLQLGRTVLGIYSNSR